MQHERAHAGVQPCVVPEGGQHPLYLRLHRLHRGILRDIPAQRQPARNSCLGMLQHPRWAARFETRHGSAVPVSPATRQEDSCNAYPQPAVAKHKSSKDTLNRHNAPKSMSSSEEVGERGQWHLLRVAGYKPKHGGAGLAEGGRLQGGPEEQHGADEQALEGRRLLCRRHDVAAVELC